MPFLCEKLKNGDYEVVMLKGTVHRGHQRRFALCTHENDAETIVELLNEAEKNGVLKK